MHPLRTTLRTLAVATLITGAWATFAQAQQGAGHAHAHGAADSQAQAPNTPTAHGAGMMMASHANDEASFLAHMIPHHQEAVNSARALLAVTERPELRALADAIIASQTAEIEAMEAWLAAWHPDAPRDMAYQPMMRDLGPNADAAAVEQAFLEDMIMHHMMAVRDARMLVMQGRVENDEVGALAQSIIDEQLTEIDLMRGWLAEWFGITTPMGAMHGDAAAPMGAMDHAGMGHGAAHDAHGGMGMQMQHGGMGMMHGGMGMMHGGMGTQMQHGGMGMMQGGHQHHGADGLVDAAAAAQLAQAFLDGRGTGTVTTVAEPVITYEVQFTDASGGGVLIVDARTGAVRLATER